MTFHWVDLALTLVIVVAGCATSYFLLLRKIRQSDVEGWREMDLRLSALTEVITSLEARVAEIGVSSNANGMREGKTESVADVAEQPVLQESEEIAPEIRVAIAAAAVAVLGQNARVRSANEITSREAVSPWSQQGRVSVQASHNLRARG